MLLHDAAGDADTRQERPPGDAPASGPAARRSRLATLTLVAVVAVASSSGTILVLSDRVASRAEAVANARSGIPQPATAAVTRRVLNDSFAFRAGLQPGSTRKVGLPQALNGVVTAVPVRRGRPVRLGSAVLEIQGRPVFLVPGAFPYYRDLRRGDRGPDVRQLQQALRSLGYRIPWEHHAFGPRTERALERFYRERGWEPPRQEPPETATEEPPPGKAPEGGQDGPPVASPSPSAGPTTRPGPSVKPLVYARAAELWSGRQELPALDSVDVRVGTVLGEAATALGSYVPRARLSGEVPSARLALLDTSPDVAVDIAGRAVRGRIAVDQGTTGDGESGDQEGSDREGSGGADVVPVTVELPATVKPAAGRSYKVTVQGPRTDGPVLAVPVTAVNERADGSAFVSTRPSTGAGRDVEVRIGVQTQGWIEVEPVAGADLQAGDLVVVGVTRATG